MTKTTFGTPEQKGNVTIYPAVPVEILRTAHGRKIRAAAYVRVSTDSTQQESSLVLQREYFENQLKNNPEYEFAGIYEDDGISATGIEKRKGFRKIIKDCEAGKIDLILTKSISRFARNVGDLLHSINMLNALNPPVEIRFEMENISTFTPMGEMLITVLGILAQWESQLKSESITWAIDNLFSQGKFYVPAIYGFTKEKGRDKHLAINEEEAKIVRLCYAMTAEGYSFANIADTLNTLGIKGRNGNTSWTAGGVKGVLANEKYVGDLRARKTVTPNYKTHKVKKNEGEKPQYYVVEHHDPIVPQLAYNVALKILRNRRGNMDGIPCLKAVPEGILKGFVIVNKAIRGYTLNDYAEASRSVCDEEADTEISIFADKASIFDLRNYDAVSSLLFDERTKPSCLIKNGQVIFNAACRKALGSEKAEILFHPAKAILAIRSSVDENVLSYHANNVLITKSINLSPFVPVALEAAGLKLGYKYRIYGARRAKNGESVMFFDLRDAKIIPEQKDGYILPDRYVERYGDGYYENFVACDLHKIDIEGLWQALQESRPAGSLAGDIVELTDFRQNTLAEFGLLEKINN